MCPDSPVVWTYWETPPGKVRSVYLDLCLQTIERHAPPLELRCLDFDTGPEALPGIDLDRWRSLPAPNFRSDYVRSRVLQRYGGIWIDIDTIALAPLTQLIAEVDDTGVVCFGREVGRFYGGLCAAAAGAPFVEMWAAEQDKALDRCEDWSSMSYAALAQDVTWHVARRMPWKALPMNRVAPVPWHQWRRFLSRVESPRTVLAAAPPVVVLWNAVMAPLLRPLSSEQLLHSRRLISRLLRIGLGHSRADQEEDVLTLLEPLSRLRFSKRGQRIEQALRRP